jgi:cytosine/creatinine deaminase
MTRVLANAMTADGRFVDVTLDGATIRSVTDAGSVRNDQIRDQIGDQVDDLAGMLLLPAMAEPHAHLDKALTADVAPNPQGDLLGAIDAWVSAIECGLISPADTVVRGTAALDRLLLNGVTAVRTHVNVGEDAGVAGIVALKQIQASFEGLLDLQIVALTHSPMTFAEGAGNRAALRDALDIGIDAVGGCPHLDPYPNEVIRIALELAAEYGIAVDLHMDETLNPAMFALPDLARQVIASGFAGRVAASHCVSLSMQPLDVQQMVAEQVAEAGIAVFPLPQTNLFLQGREHRVAMPRALAPIDVLRRAGVLVAAGADNVQDPFNPVGRSDPLETAALTMMAAHQLPDVAYDLVSNDVRAALGLPRIVIEPGSPAELVAIAAPSLRGAIADAPVDRRVYHRGRLVAVSTSSRQVLRD